MITQDDRAYMVISCIIIFTTIKTDFVNTWCKIFCVLVFFFFFDFFFQY